MTDIFNKKKSNRFIPVIQKSLLISVYFPKESKKIHIEKIHWYNQRYRSREFGLIFPTQGLILENL